MSQTRLLLLGPPVCERAGSETPFPAERPYQLLVYLAARQEWIGRDQLAALFWPEQRNLEARRNLRRILHGARRIDGANELETHGDLVCWRIATDLAEFERALHAGRPRDALAMVRGPFGAGLDDPACEGFNEWLMFERNRVGDLWRAAAQPLLKDSSPATALEVAGRMLAVDAFDDEALRAKLAALATLGRTGEAQHEYRAFARRLAEELGVEPSATTREVARRLERPTAPTPAAVAEGGFIGRAREFDQLKALLAATDTRLITVTGPGGVGKTSLVRELYAAHREQCSALARFGDGVLWIDLFDLATAEAIAPRIAAELALPLVAGTPAAEQVIKRLQAARRLIVLDNCEHLLDVSKPGAGAAAIVTAILRDCPNIVVLTTSRQRLGVAGERLLVLGGLESAAADARASAVLATESARLFCARANAALAGFDARANALEIGTICRLSNGLPLALELAAAWVRLLPCAEIAHELAAGLEVLQPTFGDRGLRAAFERSWQLAAPHEREVLSQLSIFAGGFPREAARAVAGASLPALATLVDVSLLRVEQRADSSRFSLHPLLREFTREKLRANPARLDVAQRRHTDYYARFLQRFADFRRVEQKTALDAIGLELEDCIAAWNRAVEAGDTAYLAAAAAPLEKYFNVRGRFTEGISLFERARDALDETVQSHVAALTFIEASLGILLYRAGALDRAELVLRQALARTRASELGRVRKSSLNTLGLVFAHRALWEEAKACFNQALELARADHDDEGVATFLGAGATVEKSQGNLARAEAMYRSVMQLQRRSNNLTGLATTLNNLGNLLRLDGRLDQSNAVLLEALALCEARAFTNHRAFLLVNLGLTAFAAGQSEAARAHTQRALEQARAIGSNQVEANALGQLARLAVRDGDLSRARGLLKTALQIALASGIAPIESVLLTWFGEILAAEGDLRRAAAVWSWVADQNSTEAETRGIACALLDQFNEPVRRTGHVEAAHVQRDHLVAEILSA
jgi:predicted ATPase/DNA-binding SARP family transcriptional activator/Tfp pilus assembly protein PilF